MRQQAAVIVFAGPEHSDSTLKNSELDYAIPSNWSLACTSRGGKEAVQEEASLEHNYSGIAQTSSEAFPSEPVKKACSKCCYAFLWRGCLFCSVVEAGDSPAAEGQNACICAAHCVSLVLVLLLLFKLAAM
jgi:hypothetical protein